MIPMHFIVSASGSLKVWFHNVKKGHGIDETSKVLKIFFYEKNKSVPCTKNA